MTFTDAELETLKKFLKNVPENPSWADKQLRLIYRLEAAEQICEWVLKAFPKLPLEKGYGFRKWRRAAGK